jgi:hypothetical protein
MPAIRPSLAAATLALAFASPFAALAQETALTIPTQPGGPVSVNVSYSINETLSVLDPDAVAALEAAYRDAMLKRTNGECAAVLATIATDCAVTAITFSSQVNSYPGQPPALYVSSTVSLQITLKSAAP